MRDYCQIIASYKPLTIRRDLFNGWTLCFQYYAELDTLDEEDWIEIEW